MTIDFKEGILSLRDVFLSSNQKSQLYNWGFRSDGENLFELSKGNLEKTLIKVVKYFKKEKIKYNTTKNLDSKIAFILENTEQFNSIKNTGENFKKGIFNKKEFGKFKLFLKEHLTTRVLKGHQLKAAYHLYLVHNGANFSVPGSGKTSVVLSVYEKLKL